MVGFWQTPNPLHFPNYSDDIYNDFIDYWVNQCEEEVLRVFETLFNDHCQDWKHTVKTLQKGVPNLVWYSLVLFGMVQLGPFWHGGVWLPLAWYSMTYFVLMQSGPFWYDRVWPLLAWCSLVSFGIIQFLDWLQKQTANSALISLHTAPPYSS